MILNKWEIWKKIFKDLEIIDLIDLYQQKYLEKEGSLSEMTFKLCGKKLYKVEQCSNGENRPLRPEQMIYAAIDALICIKLFKLLINK